MMKITTKLSSAPQFLTKLQEAVKLHAKSLTAGKNHKNHQNQQNQHFTFFLLFLPIFLFSESGVVGGCRGLSGEPSRESTSYRVRFFFLFILPVAVGGCRGKGSGKINRIKKEKKRKKKEKKKEKAPETIFSEMCQIAVILRKTELQIKIWWEFLKNFACIARLLTNILQIKGSSVDVPLETGFPLQYAAKPHEMARRWA